MANGTQQAETETPLLRRILIDLAVMSAIGFVLALIGPLGSYATPFAQRLIYWMVMCYAGYLFYRPLSAIILRLGPKLDLPSWPLWIFAVLVATVPMAIVVWMVGYLAYGEMVVPTLEQAAQHYFNVLVIGAGITLVFGLVNRQPAPAAPTTHEPIPVAPSSENAESLAVAEIPDPAEARFLDRLPPDLGSELIALEMEDHYVRAHTALGSDLVLMRMRDAVAELGALEGEQIHRSWWVARGAVSDVVRDGRNVRLKLDNDIEAPVSRANVTKLKELGWI